MGSKGWLRAELWGAGHSHTPVSTHLFSGEALLFGRGVGVAPAWGGAGGPFSGLWGSLTGRKDSSPGWWECRGDGLSTRNGTSLTWGSALGPVAGRALQAGRGLLAWGFQVQIWLMTKSHGFKFQKRSSVV